jgi:hypothetical protein
LSFNLTTLPRNDNFVRDHDHNMANSIQATKDAIWLKTQAINHEEAQRADWATQARPRRFTADRY